MIHATINTVSVDFKCGDGNIFRANGSTIVDPGFMAVYQEDVDDKKGVVSWTRLLPPGKEVSLRYGYSVAYPEERKIQGL